MDFSRPEKSVKVYSAYHRPFYIPKTPWVVPIQVGRAVSSITLPMIGDDTGESISEKNASFCELTALYWIWKNTRTDYVGLFHYRRYLNLGRVWFVVRAPFPNSLRRFQRIEHKILRTKTLNDEMCQNRLILPTPIRFKAWNLETQFKQAHPSKDWDLLISVVMDRCKADGHTQGEIARAIGGRYFYPCNMFIVPFAYFEAYMEWLFSILSELEPQVNLEGRDSYQKRAFGFWAERMFTIYVLLYWEDLPKTHFQPFWVGE
jgi:hypothetical protein